MRAGEHLRSSCRSSVLTIFFGLLLRIILIGLVGARGAGSFSRRSAMCARLCELFVWSWRFGAWCRLLVPSRARGPQRMIMAGNAYDSHGNIVDGERLGLYESLTTATRRRRDSEVAA